MLITFDCARIHSNQLTAFFCDAGNLLSLVRMSPGLKERIKTRCACPHPYVTQGFCYLTQARFRIVCRLAMVRQQVYLKTFIEATNTEKRTLITEYDNRCNKFLLLLLIATLKAAR